MSQTVRLGHRSQRPELSTNKIRFRFPFSLTLNNASFDFSPSFLESKGVSSKTGTVRLPAVQIQSTKHPLRTDRHGLAGAHTIFRRPARENLLEDEILGSLFFSTLLEG
jgi:hypothetical protein